MNGLLAISRRTSAKGTAHHGAPLPQTAPSVPPELQQIFQIPETPAPAPRRPAHRRTINGRRAPPGPPPPLSWISLAQSRHAPADYQAKTAGRIQHYPLPGAYEPGEGSLVAAALQCLAKDWEQQREWNKFYLYTLANQLRVALLAYVSELYEPGLSSSDLRLVLAGPPEEELLEYGLERVDPSKWNADMHYLDLGSSIGKSLSLRELGDLLCPPKVEPADEDVFESWDAAEPLRVPTTLLPNLTHLSLASDPASNPSLSWRQLLSFASKMPTLTHLNLSGWPEPSLTPNAKLAKVTSTTTGQSVQYGGTGPYSHSLDGDWTEAALLLRKLSKALYRLEYLDLTGCADWFPALRSSASSSSSSSSSTSPSLSSSPGTHSANASIDWVGDWGKITDLRLCSGYALPEDASPVQISRFNDWIAAATEVERHIRTQRQGQGRWITVEKDSLSEDEKRRLASI